MCEIILHFKKIDYIPKLLSVISEGEEARGWSFS